MSVSGLDRRRSRLQPGREHPPPTGARSTGEISPYVLDSDDLSPGDHRRVQAEDLPVLLIRTATAIHALQHWCPHAGAPLSEGEVDDEAVTCHWHGSKFCIADGPAAAGPSDDATSGLQGS
ncbi:MAG: Rieske 2Fe-2S domain-containing protein [Thermomicrobiales bacterium]